MSEENTQPPISSAPTYDDRPTSPTPRSPVDARPEIQNDVKVTTELIAEYTTRLLGACHSGARQRAKRMFSLGMLMVFSSTAVVSVFWLLPGLSREAASAMPVLGVVGALSGIVSGAFLAAIPLQRHRLERDEVRLTARGLAVLVHHASAVYENREVGNTERLLLEVRLGEAEAALEISTRYGADSELLSVVPLTRASPVRGLSIVSTSTVRTTSRTVEKRPTIEPNG